MKIRIIIIMLLMSLIFACSSSFLTFQMYGGQQLPKEKVGMIFCRDVYELIIDDNEIDLKTKMISEDKDCQVHLLPGEHTIFVRWPRKIHIGIDFSAKALLSFTVEAGHNYELIYDTVKHGNPLVLGFFIPYIKDVTVKFDKRVNTNLISGYDLLGDIEERTFRYVAYVNANEIRSDAGGRAFLPVFEFEVYYEWLPEGAIKIVDENSWYNKGDIIKFKKEEINKDNYAVLISMSPQYITYIMTPLGNWHKIWSDD
ncbi:MAG: hypothetical protein WBC20_11975 [Candidatus Aminicenantaceae bacterium]